MNNLGPLTLAIPVYNCEKYLPATLASLAKNGSDVRWWLQDGNSTDDTVALAWQYARNSDVIISEPDKGQTDGLNKAIPRMGGEIIGYINGDDCLLPDAATRVLDFFARNPQIDLVYGGVQWIDAEGTGEGWHQGRINSLEDVLDIYRVWWNERQWVQPEVFFRRSVWERVGLFNTAYNLAFDYEYWVRCFRAGIRVASLDTPLVQFRRHAEQKSAAARKAADEIRQIVQSNLDDGAPITSAVRWRLNAQLQYDRFHLQPGEGRPSRSFLRKLVLNPHWLLAPHVRKRIAVSFQRAITGAKP